VKYAGWLVGLYLPDGPDYRLITALVTKGFEVNGGTVDVTDSDGGWWRELLDDPVAFEVKFSASGIIENSWAVATLANLAYTGTKTPVLLTFADDQSIEMVGIVETFEANGEYNGAQLYDVVIVGTPGEAIETETIILTSKPYGVLVVESMATDVNVRTFDTRGIPIDNFTTAVNVVSFNLREPLLTYTIPPENIQTEIAVVSFSLRVALLEYTVPPENIQTSVNVVSFRLRTYLIQYTNWTPENIKTDVNVVSFNLETP